MAQSAVYRVASEGYFIAMGRALTRGRGFDARDAQGGEPVAVINEALVASTSPDATRWASGCVSPAWTK